MGLSQSEFNERRLDRYNEFWELLEDHGVSTPIEYLAGAFDGSDSLPIDKPIESFESIHSDTVSTLDEVLHLDDERHRHWLSRFYPYNNQQVFFGLEEPLLGQSLKTNEHIRLAQADLNPNQLATISSNYYVDYLAGEYGANNKSSDFLKLLKAIDKSNNSIGPSNSYSDYFQTDDLNEDDRFLRNVDPTKGVWADFYVSNARKLGNFTKVSFKKYTRYKQSLNNSFVDEIYAVDPSLVILSGGTAWNAVLRCLGEELKPAIDFAPTLSGKIAEVHGCLYEDSQGRFYLPVRHLGRLSRWPDNDRVRKSGEKAAKYLS